MKTELVLDALEQALWARKDRRELIHHSDRGSQYLSICYTERLAETGINASVGTTGDSYDNALAETISGFYKTTSEAPGKVVRRLNKQHWNGWVGLTMADCRNRLEIFRRQSERWNIIG